MKFGLDVGYSAGQRTGDATAQGVAFGGFLSYGFNSRWALGVEADRDWYFTTGNAPGSSAPPEETDAAGAQQDPAGTGTPTETVEETGPSRNTASGVTAVALSVIYAIDVMRLWPFVSVGVVGQLASFDDYNVGARLGVGFDYMLTENVGLGAVFHGDLFFLGSPDYRGRLSVLVRATFCFGVGQRRAAS